MNLYRLIYDDKEAWYYKGEKLFEAKMKNKYQHSTLWTSLKIFYFIIKQVIQRKIYLPNGLYDVMVVTMPAENHFPDRIEELDG